MTEKPGYVTEKPDMWLKIGYVTEKPDMWLKIGYVTEKPGYVNEQILDIWLHKPGVWPNNPNVWLKKTEYVTCEQTGYVIN